MFLYLFFACSSTNERGNLSLSSKKPGAILNVTVFPHDARITVNGLPWRGELLSKGTHTLTIEKDGYYTEQRTLSIDELERMKIDITLRSNDVPLHFYYPSEELFTVRYGDESQTFRGSEILTVPVGLVEIVSADGKVLFLDEIRSTRHVHRCPQKENQRSYCVSKLSLTNAPHDVVFCQKKLWISTLSPNRGLYEYNLTTGSLSHHLNLESTTWIRCMDDNLHLLSKKGEYSKYDVQVKKKTVLHNFSHSWLSGFVSDATTITTFNWFQDKVVTWDGDSESVLSIAKPKGHKTTQPRKT